MRSALKLQMQAMLLSTRYNSLSTVLANLHHNFTEVAEKSYYYIRSLPPAKRPSDRLLVRESTAYRFLRRLNVLERQYFDCFNVHILWSSGLHSR